jgi:hypothetical protein
MTNLTMYDSITISSIPKTAQYAAGYVGGLWPTYSSLRKELPNATLLSVAVSPAEDAECLDVENGDATIADVYAWLIRQRHVNGIARPVIYIQAGNVDKLMLTMNANLFSRDSYRLWSAHYGQGNHVCGPATCKECSTAVDGTQWTDTADGKNLDQSSLLPTFF